MKKRDLLLFAFSVLSLALISNGVVGQVIREISLDEALQLLNRNNLQLRVSRSEAEIVYGEARQNRAFPNPAGQFTHETLAGNGIGYSETYFNLRQPVLLPWMSSARSAAGRAMETGATAQVAADSNQLQSGVKRDLVFAIAAERRSRVVNEVLAVFRSVEAAAAARFAEGDISGYDLRRIRVELARYERTHDDALLRRDNARRSLTVTLLPGVTDTVLAAIDFLGSDPPPLARPNLPVLALAQRPEMEVRRSGIESSQARWREARGGRWLEQLTLTGGYKRQSDGLNGAFLGAEVPIPLWNRQGGVVDARDARLAVAYDQARITELIIVDDVRTAAAGYELVRARTLRIEQRLYEDTADLLAIARASFDDGEIGLLGLLDAADAYYTSRSDQITLRAELWDQYFDLERAVGGFHQTPAPQDDRP